MPRTQVRRDAVKSVSKIEANRRNARASTGPRTAAGKARAAQNARRHGLNLPARYDPSRSGEIVTLARAIAGTDAGAERFELASRIAAAQIDVERARQARLDLYPQALRERDAIARLAAIDRYEGRALSLRKRAMRDFDDASDRACPGTLAGISAERSHRTKVRRMVGNGGLGAASVSFKLSASSIYPWDGPEAALIRSMIAELLRSTRPLPGHFDKTKPTAKAARVTECAAKIARGRPDEQAFVGQFGRTKPSGETSLVGHPGGAKPTGKTPIVGHLGPTKPTSKTPLVGHIGRTKPTGKTSRVPDCSLEGTCGRRRERLSQQAAIRRFACAASDPIKQAAQRKGSRCGRKTPGTSGSIAAAPSPT